MSRRERRGGQPGADPWQRGLSSPGSDLAELRHQLWPRGPLLPRPLRGGHLQGLDRHHVLCCGQQTSKTWWRTGGPCMTSHCLTLFSLTFQNILMFNVHNIKLCPSENNISFPTSDRRPTNSRSEHLHVHLLCLLHYLWLLFHPQSLHRGHHWQLQWTEKEDKYSIKDIQYSEQK